MFHILYRDLKVKYLIIENFIPVDEKNKLLARIRYDEEEDTFCISPYEEEAPAISKRPLSADNERRPVSDYSRVAIKVGRHHRYHVSHINLHSVIDGSFFHLIFLFLAENVLWRVAAGLWGGGRGRCKGRTVASTLTLRRLMSYIYGAPILDVSRSHTTTQHSR